MITYEYECEACGLNFDVEQSIKDCAYTVCPECNTDTLFRVLHSPLHIQIKGEPTTVGQLAEQNAKHLSREQMDKVQANWKTQKTISRIPEEHRPASVPQAPLKDSPPWLDKARTKTTKDVLKMTPEQTKKYVQTGE